MVHCPACGTHFPADASPAEDGRTSLLPLDESPHEPEEPHRQLFREAADEVEAPLPPLQVGNETDTRRGWHWLATAISFVFLGMVVFGLVRTFLPREKEAAWHTFTPEGGGFRIEFPNPPKQRIEWNRSVLLAEMSRPQLECGLQILELEAPIDPPFEQQELRSVVDRLAAELHGRAILVREFRLAGRSGLETELHGRQRFFRLRCCLTPRRLYVVWCQARQRDTLYHAHAEHFLNSFRLVD